MNTYNIPSNLQETIKSELKSGEKVVWAEQPIPELYKKAGLAVWLFFIPWTLFSMFWIAGAAGFKIPDFSQGGFELFPLFGLPFLLIGLWGLLLPFRIKKQAQEMVYVITNLRAFSIEGIKTVKFKSYNPKEFSQLERKQNQDGTGDITFMKETYTDSDGDRRSRDHGFFAIKDVKRVEALLENILDSSKTIT